METFVDLYLRLSEGRDLSSLDAREKELRGEAASRGWTVHRVVIENDLSPGKAKNASAFKRRKVTLPDGTRALRTVRPGFRSILDDFVNGHAHAMLAEDLDRVLRDFRDAEDLLDIAEMHKISAASLSESFTLTNGGTDEERDRIRDHVRHNNKSSRDTGRRVSAARVRQSAKGYFRGGRRPYGYQPVPKPDGKYQNSEYTLVEAERDEMVKALDSAMTGVPLRSIVRDMNARGVPTVLGSKWVSTTLRDILIRPLNVGREKDGKVLIPAIFTEDEHKAIVGKLTNPERVTKATGPAPHWLGTGIYRCVCGATMEIQSGKNRPPTYRCGSRDKAPGSLHVRRNAAAVDEYVIAHVVEFMSRPDAAELTVSRPAGVDVNALRAEVKLLRERETGLAESYADGDITKAQMVAGTERIAAKLSRAEQALATQTDRSPLTPLVGAEDVLATWQALPFGHQRAVVQRLMSVTIAPSARKGSGFDEASVDIQRRPVAA